MQVKGLIEELSEYDPEAFIMGGDFEDYRAGVETHLITVNDGSAPYDFASSFAQRVLELPIGTAVVIVNVG